MQKKFSIKSIVFQPILVAFYILFLVTTPFFAQNQVFTFDVAWGEPHAYTNGDLAYQIPTIQQQNYNGNRVHASFRVPIPAGFGYKANVINTTFSSLKNEDLTYFSNTGVTVEQNQFVKAAISKERGALFLQVDLFPYAIESGQAKRISQVTVELIRLNPISTLQPKDFVANSVLGDASSQWYKIAVPADGIYKIDRTFLQNLGINVSGLNPQHINIYGNGQGRLPELNSIPRPDDLVKNDIYIEGESDGSFDAQDYILFHGFGPSRTLQVGSFFEQDLNPYTFQAYYFIRISSNEPPARIQVEDNSNLSHNQSVNSFNYFAVYQKELKNLVGGGQRFYGELFDTELTQTFSFAVPNILPDSPLRFRVSMASNLGGTSANFSVNGTNLLSRTFSVFSDFTRIDEAFVLNNPAAQIPLQITVNRPNPTGLTYLDEIEINARRGLTMVGSQMVFRDLASIGLGNVSQFTVSNLPAAGFVWDITDRQRPKRMGGNFSGNQFVFKASTDTLREFIASTNSGFLTPIAVGSVAPQNLHGLEANDLVIVTHPTFISQANRLADLHRSEGLVVHVVTSDQVFNEFSSGAPDPTAIRWLMKMFYDRANGVDSLMPKNLLLFGDGTYDPRNIMSNANYMITYQFLNSENPIDALVSDDYFGLLDDNESIVASNAMDIGVGRLLISDLTIAREQVDKIESYMKNGMTSVGNQADCCGASLFPTEGSFGDWRLNYVQITDDEEDGWFINKDAEPQSAHVLANHPEMNVDKLYTDAFPQVTTAGGQRYPSVFDAITDRIQRGAILMNYVGHGGESGAAEERIITIPQILAFANAPRYPLFVSATCEFTRYDDPERVSAGEWMALNSNGGAIALMTTTRAVYFSTNTITGQRFFENVFTRDENLEPLSFGEIIRLTKNQATSGDNKRSFTLIGDPALKIALPRLKVVTDSINGFSPNLYVDTVEALSKMRVSGHIEDQFGNILTNYNGVLSPTIFDKPKKIKTLGQDPSSPIIEFDVQRNAMYKGKATVSNGYFSFEFIAPKDINYAFGNGKLSYYANNTTIDAGGSDTRFIVGGLNLNGLNDVEGPTVELFLNDENFVSGGLTDETPRLIAKIFDENGINTVGNGIGHDITAILDGNTAEPIVLNDFYVSDLDTYQSGKLEYNFSRLAPGNHTLDFKVWDVNNNSSSIRIEFTVAEKQELALDHVLNYPNPFTTRTTFFFEHNQVCESLETQIQIFTISGKLVKTINQLVRTNGFRTEGVEWDGRDEYGDQLAKGVYIYRLSVKSPDGDLADKIEKLVLLK